MLSPESQDSDITVAHTQLKKALDNAQALMSGKDEQIKEQELCMESMRQGKKERLKEYATELRNLEDRLEKQKAEEILKLSEVSSQCCPVHVTPYSILIQANETHTNKIAVELEKVYVELAAEKAKISEAEVYSDFQRCQ